MGKGSWCGQRARWRQTLPQNFSDSRYHPKANTAILLLLTTFQYFIARLQQTPITGFSGDKEGDSE
jgi:hypothetical protein